MYDEAQKKAIYKWRETNKEKYREISKLNTFNYRLKNKDRLLAKKVFQTEWKLLCKIDI